MDIESIMVEIKNIINKYNYEDIENIILEIGYRNKDEDYHYCVDEFEIELHTNIK